MNKEKSSDKKDTNKSDGSDEQPHMRIEAKATTEEKRMYEKKMIVNVSSHFPSMSSFILITLYLFLKLCRFE